MVKLQSQLSDILQKGKFTEDILFLEVMSHKEEDFVYSAFPSLKAKFLPIIEAVEILNTHLKFMGIVEAEI